LNWYSQIKKADSFIGYQDDQKSKSRIVQMIKGLSRSRNLDASQQQHLIDEAVDYISKGYDEQSVINLMQQRLA